VRRAQDLRNSTELSYVADPDDIARSIRAIDDRLLAAISIFTMLMTIPQVQVQ
jgi:hypothetical protein